MEHQKSYFWFPRLSGVTIAMSFSGSTRDFLKLSFHKFSKVKSDSKFKTSIPKYLKIPNFSQLGEGVWELRASEG